MRPLPSGLGETAQLGQRARSSFIQAMLRRLLRGPPMKCTEVQRGRNQISRMILCVFSKCGCVI
jgi:hypothetical protein